MFQNYPMRQAILATAKSGLLVALLVSLVTLALAPDTCAQYQPRKQGPAAVQASITVTGPAAGVAWETGKRYEITWNSSGIRGAVKIELIDSKGKATPVIRQVTNNGKYSFSLMQSIAVGDYKVRVSSTDGKTVGETPGTVKISKAGGAVKKTATAGAYQPATGIQQTGTPSATDAAKPTYEPRTTGQVAGQAGGLTPATGTPGTVGGIQEDDSRPSVQGGVADAGAATQAPGASVSTQTVVNADPNVAVSNEVLQQHVQGSASELGTVILPGIEGTPAGNDLWGSVGDASQNANQQQQMGDITIVSPAGGELWETDQVQTISWEGENTTNAIVKLIREGYSTVTLSNSSGNANSINYTPPPRSAAGHNMFWIQVTTPNGTARATSPEPFSIWSGVPVDLMCGIRDFGGGVNRDGRGFFHQPRHTRYIDFEIWVINKGTQFIEHLPFVCRVIKYPENLRLEYFEAGFTNVDSRMWLKTNEPIRFDLESWKGDHRDVNVMWESGTYNIEVEVDPRNEFGEPDIYRLDNKVTITFVVE